MKDLNSWSEFRQQAEDMQLNPRSSAWNRIRERLDHRQRPRIRSFRFVNMAALVMLFIGRALALRWWVNQPSLNVDGEVLVNQSPVPQAKYPDPQRYQHSAPDYAEHVQLSAARDIDRHLRFASAMDHLPDIQESWVAPLQGTWILSRLEDAVKVPWRSITFNPVGVFQWEGKENAKSWQFLKLPDQSTYYILQNNPDTLLLIQYAGGNKLTVMHYNEGSGTFDEIPMQLNKQG